MCRRQRQVGARHGTIRPLRRCAEHIFEFSHIARPIVSLQHFDGFVGDRAGMNGRNTANEKFGKRRNVLLALAQRRYKYLAASQSGQKAVFRRMLLRQTTRTASSISSATGEARSISSTKRLPPSARSSSPAAFSVPHKSVCAAVPVKQDPATTTKGREARALFS